jgi:hypothetical protein
VAGGVYGDGVRRAMGFGVVDDHLRKGEAGGMGGGEGGTYQSTGGELAGRFVERLWGLKRVIPGMADHEGHFLSGDCLGGNDEVALIFSVLRVEHDNELSSLCSDPLALLILPEFKRPPLTKSLYGILYTVKLESVRRRRRRRHGRQTALTVTPRMVLQVAVALLLANPVLSSAGAES